MILNNKIFILSFSFLFFFLLVTACDDVMNKYEKVKKEAVESVDDALDKYDEVKKETVDSVVKKAEEIKDKAGKSIDFTTAQISKYLDIAINKIVLDVKEWIHAKLIPIYPWAFIILFLFISAALKYLVPMSGVGIIQLTLTFLSYIFTFLMFYFVGLAYFALKGTFYLMIPFLIIGVIVYFKDKLFLLTKKYSNNKFIQKLSGGEAKDSRYGIWANKVRNYAVMSVKNMEKREYAKARQQLVRVINSLSDFSDMQKTMEP